MLAFRTRHKEPGLVRCERFCEKDIADLKRETGERDPEAEENGVRAIKKRFGEERNVFYLWGDRGAGRGCVKMKPQGNWEPNVRMFVLGLQLWSGLLARPESRKGECCASSGAEGIQADGGGGTRRYKT